MIDALPTRGLRRRAMDALDNAPDCPPALIRDVEVSAFGFTDLAWLPPEAVAIVNPRVADDDWAFALKGVAAAVYERVMTAMPAERAAVIGKRMHDLGPVREREAMDSRDTVARAVRRAIHRGEIAWVARHRPAVWAFEWDGVAFEFGLAVGRLMRHAGRGLIVTPNAGVTPDLARRTLDSPLLA
ncbi:MAG: hypothetical protein HQL38_01055, partial [Alphaproteobacteria bacterium]|nr:hypothetical protein [Alphaproteobacteria bacterium]